MQAAATATSETPGEAAPACGAAAPAARPTLDGADVLVVDDYQDCREMYAAWLSLAGFRVLTAGSGVEALKLAREFLPSIILMDLCLPGIDGCEVTRQLKADRATRHIPVIALTALSPPSPSRLATIGFESIILKPCLPDDLADHLARVLGSRRPISSDC